MGVRTAGELTEGLDEIRRSPSDNGTIEMIVRRPDVDQREVVAEALLDPEHGLVGDTWRMRGSSRTPDGAAHPGMQLTLMNARAVALLAGSRDRWPLAGDQIYVDLDLSAANLPPGTRLSLGSAEIEVSDQPHRGCKKFAERYGIEALRFVNSDQGVALNLRGINCRVVRAGSISSGGTVRKI